MSEHLPVSGAFPAAVDPVAALEQRLESAERRIAYRDWVIASLEKQVAVYRNRRVRSVPQEEIEILEASLKVAELADSNDIHGFTAEAIEALKVLVLRHREAGDL